MKKIVCLLIMAAQLSACATYEGHSVSFRPAKEYINYQDASGLLVGAESFAEKSIAEKAFGFDIRTAGILPVKVVLENKSGQSVEVVSGQTFLIDGTNRYWKILSNREAVDKVQKSTETAGITSGAGKSVTSGTSVATLIELAIGVVSKKDVGSSAAKGNGLGSAGGTAVSGSGKSGDDKQREVKTAEAVREKGIEGKIISFESLASGFIFFPGEISSISELRLQVKFRDSGRIQTLNMKLN